MSWESTRKGIRNLEVRLDASLNQYSRLAADINRSGGPSNGTVKPWPGQMLEEGRRIRRGKDEEVDNGEQMEQEIERMLTELSSNVDKLANSLNDPMNQSSASQQHTLQRHREVLLDFERDYRRSKTNVKQARDRKDLLGSVKVDIENYKARQGTDAESLLAERSRLDNSHSMIDGTLDQAYATRADLSQQRSTLVDMTSRLTNTANQIPGLNNLIRLIHRRRQRDRVIMGVVIGTCTVLILMYLTR